MPTSKRLYTLSVTYPAAALTDARCADCGEPVESQGGFLIVHSSDGGLVYDIVQELKRDWEPEGWLADPVDREEWIARYDSARFFWPKADKIYFTRGTARKRAKLLESYGAKVTIIESEPIVWLTPERIRENRIEELEREIADLRTLQEF